MTYLPIILHIIVTVLAVGALAVKVEHRLTQIETDIGWIKEKLDKVVHNTDHHKKTES